MASLDLSEQEADLEAQIKTYRTQVSRDRILLCSDGSSFFFSSSAMSKRRCQMEVKKWDSLFQILNS